MILSILDHDSIVCHTRSTYKVENIEASKKKLFDICCTSRYMAHMGEKKDALHIKDMIKLLQKRGTDTPTFVCKPDDLGTLQPISFDNIDVSMLLTHIQKSQDEVATLMDTMTTQNEAIRQLSAVNSGLDLRMKRLERQHDDPFYNIERSGSNYMNEQMIQMKVVGSAIPIEEMQTGIKATFTEVVRKDRKGDSNHVKSGFIPPSNRAKQDCRYPSTSST